MQNTIMIVTAVALGMIIGRWAGLVVMMLFLAGSLLTSVVLRVVAHERNTGVSHTARIAFALGIATLAGRLIGWFGLVGGFLALVLIVVALVVAGADIA